MQEIAMIKLDNMKYILIILSILSFNLLGNTQNVEFKSSNFKNRKEEFKKVSEDLDKGDEYFEIANAAFFDVKPLGINYEMALKYFQIAQKFNSNSATLNYKIGVCYANGTDPEKCISYLKKANSLDPECDPFLPYYIGYALQLEGKFDEATKSYQAFESEYKKADNFSKFVSQRKGECKTARDLLGSPIRAWVDNVSELNTPYNDFAPSISTDGSELIMSSDRPNKHKANDAGSYDADIYTSILFDGKWTPPAPIRGNVNTDQNDIANNLSYDGTKMLLHREVDGQLDIFESELKGLEWSVPKSMGMAISSNRSNDSYASYYPDGYTIYFARDNDNRSNGTEIMYSSMQSKMRKDYMAATMLQSVNSKFNEGPIFCHLDGETMYIASNGNNTIGGYDIFVSRKVQGQWSKPENMGYPINTPYDDFFFASTANGKFAYIASNRSGGQGNYDIYKVTFWGPEKIPTVDMEDFLLSSIVMPMKDAQVEAAVDVNKKTFTVFKGKTIDALTKKAVEASIEITDNSTGKVIETFTTNSATGKFIITLISGKNYGIAVKADGYLFHSENFDIPKGSDDNLVNKTIELKNIAIGSKIELRNIFFDIGKANLRSESNSELDRLVKLMQDVPSLKIEIGGHTDNTGSASLNQKLSQDRADAVVNYLKSNGISAGRMNAKGYGDSVPVASNANESGRQQNRRTEFEIKGN
jgi:outer membrane protein OmpA-like peptidoglycan-associated protein/tetratricopeptide (TPR) repeat protein